MSVHKFFRLFMSPAKITKYKNVILPNRLDITNIVNTFKQRLIKYWFTVFDEH